MNRITKKLFISILTVITTVIALGTTTFAWFTLTNVATIEPFQAQVRAEQGIEISLDGINWYNTLDSAKILQQLATNGFERFNHVTSEDGFSFQTFNKEHTDFESADKQYINLRIHFRAINIAKLHLSKITLTGNTSQGSTINWNVDVPFEAKDEEMYGPAIVDKKTLAVDPSDAIRISIVLFEDNLGELEFVKVLDAYEKGTDDTNTYVGPVNVLVDGENSGDEVPTYGAYSYYKAKTNKEPLGWATKKLVKTTSLEDFEGLEIFEFDAEDDGYQYVVIDINIWVEGYDPEAYNALLDLPIFTSFEFTGELPE